MQSKNMKIILLTVILSAFLERSIASIVSGGPSWNYVSMEDPVTDLQKLFAAGLENKANSQTTHVQYLCRARVDNHWVPGKLIYLEAASSITCYVVTYSGSLQQFDLHYDSLDSIQVLMGHPSWTSWIPYNTADELPKEFVSGGLDLNGKDVPLCRVRDDDGYVCVGHFRRSTSECVYDFDGAKQSQKGIEILVLNPLGQKLNELL